jgi:hypothetical protein
MSERKELAELAFEEAILDAMLEAQVIADPSRFTSADALEHFVLPALERAAPENVEKRKNDFGKHLREILGYVTNEQKQVRLSILFPVMSMVGGANMDGRYEGMRAGYALHEYGKWLHRQEWLKKVMLVMRDHPGIKPDRMCRELDRRYKQTVREGKHREEKATPETWDNLTWIQEFENNRTNVDVFRSKAKKQLESENFKLLSAWYKLDGKDPLSKREPDDDKEFE